MARLNKNIVSPVVAIDGGHLFHAAGKTFKMTESEIQPINSNYPELNVMVFAAENFNVSPAGMYFYYDYNAKSSNLVSESKSFRSADAEALISKGREAAIENFDAILEAKEKLNFLTEEKKRLKRLGTAAANEALVELEETCNIINESIINMGNKPSLVVFKYDASENKTFINSSEVLGESITDYAFGAGIIKYEHKGLVEAFKFAAKNFATFKKIDFVSESIEGDVSILAMRLDEKAYMYRNNTATTITNFKQMDPASLVEYVLEETGNDVSFMFEDILAEKIEAKAKRDEVIKSMYEMISFLNDQRGILAEANKNIPEIKEADAFISSEIRRIKSNIAILEDEKLTRSNGYVDATLKNEYDNAPAESSVKVDALDYTSAGKDDYVSAYVNDNHIKVKKYDLELASGETI